MARYKLYVPGWAEMWTEVEVDDIGPDGKVLEGEELMDRVFDADIDTPTLCHQCAGGNWPGQPSLEIGDEWDWDKATVEKINE